MLEDCNGFFIYEKYRGTRERNKFFFVFYATFFYMRKALKERELGSSFALALHLFDPEFQKLLNLRVMRR